MTAIDHLRTLLDGLTDEQLREELRCIDTPERRAELDQRIKPYRTRVTEATMRRGC